MKKIAFVINYNHLKWLGGFQVVLNLIKSISLNKGYRIKPILFLGYKINNKIAQIDRKTKIIIDKRIIVNSNFIKIFDKIFTIFFGYSWWYTKIFKKYKIDIITHSNIALGNKNKIKSITWIPDFQFLHLKSLYSSWQIFIKKINIKFYKNHSTKILLSSNNAKKDLKKIIDINNNKLIISSFPFEVPPSSSLLNKKQLYKELKIPKNYFYLPNHYWSHKNHMVVLKALNILKNRDIFVVSTGFQQDHRNLKYFETIKNFIKNNKLEKKYIYLGIVPYKISMSLMLNSIAVINPSKFEGWSSTVEQAKSFGKKIILSNLMVHKEQKPKRSFFFNTDDYKSLSKILVKCLNHYDYKKEKKIVNENYKTLKNRLKSYGKEYLDNLNTLIN